jgi:hypothetical protein
MFSPVYSRVLLLGGLCLVLFFGVRWFLAEPTITVNFENAPLSKVLAAFSRQGKINLETNFDPNTPVTLQVTRSPVLEAIDLLAVRLDGSWRLGYIMAPDKQAVREGRSLLGSRTPTGWTSFYFPTFGTDWASTPPDPRQINWKVEPAPDGLLSSYLDQGSQKLPVQFLVPEGWNPSLAAPPSSGSASATTRQLARSTRAELGEVFFISSQGGWGGGGEGNRGEGSRQGGGDRPGVPPPTNAPGTATARPPGTPPDRRTRNENWQFERAEAMLAALPQEQRTEALSFLEEMRQLREQTRDLPEEQRREAWSEFMQRPEVQERREEAMAARDAKRTPEQREARYRRTAENRLEARAEQGRPLQANQ